MTRRRPQGQGIIEMIFGMIMFVSMIALTCTVCMFLYLQHAIVSASREGARVASVNTDYSAGNTATANTAVTTTVQQFMQQTTGQTLATNQVVITPPAGVIGQRNVTVRVNYTLVNPLPIAGFLGGLGATGTSALTNIPLVAASTMRYEE